MDRANHEHVVPLDLRIKLVSEVIPQNLRQSVSPGRLSPFIILLQVRVDILLGDGLVIGQDRLVVVRIVDHGYPFRETVAIRVLRSIATHKL